MLGEMATQLIPSHWKARTRTAGDESSFRSMDRSGSIFQQLCIWKVSESATSPFCTHVESSSLLVTCVLLSTFFATFLSRRHVTFRLRLFFLPRTTCRQTGHFQVFFFGMILNGECVLPRLKPFEFKGGRKPDDNELRHHRGYRH